MPNSPKQIHFIIQRERDIENVLRDWHGYDGSAVGRAVRGKPLPLAIDSAIQLGIQTGGGDSGKSASFYQARSGSFQSLIAVRRPLFVLVELAIAEKLPPGVLGERVQRARGLPGHGRLPILRDGRIRLG